MAAGCWVPVIWAFSQGLQAPWAFRGSKACLQGVARTINSCTLLNDFGLFLCYTNPLQVPSRAREKTLWTDPNSPASPSFPYNPLGPHPSVLSPPPPFPSCLTARCRSSVATPQKEVKAAPPWLQTPVSHDKRTQRKRTTPRSQVDLAPPFTAISPSSFG